MKEQVLDLPGERSGRGIRSSRTAEGGSESGSHGLLNGLGHGLARIRSTEGDDLLQRLAPGAASSAGRDVLLHLGADRGIDLPSVPE
jgi:hypothetical protein